MNLDHLNKQQKEAVLQTEGPLLILAGAGTGKTRVLTQRIAYLVSDKKVRSENILGVTFTNKAANEMKGRVRALTENKGNFPYLGTFHSIGVKILKRDGRDIGLNPTFSIYDTDDQLSVVKTVMKELLINPKEFNPKGIQNFISNCKNEFVTPEQAKSYAQGYFQEVAAAVYPKYQQELKRHNGVDFDDLLVKTVELFQKNPSILEKYQNIFKYIMVDEYQDTNKVQYLLIKALANKHKNIAVVGDDDQSIYSWRGATIENILSFKKDYPNAKVVKLEQNYRSTGIILNAAYEVIRHNAERMDKKLWTEETASEKIKVYSARNEYDEGDFIIKEINEKGFGYSDCVVLYRTNAQSRALEESFLRNAMPYKIVGGLKFYSRKEVKDVLAYLRVIYNTEDDVSLKRIINVPSRKIGPKTIENLMLEAKEKRVSIIKLLEDSLSETENGGVKNFAAILKHLKKVSTQLSITDLIDEILDRTGYVRSLDRETEEGKQRIENLLELKSVASVFNTLPPEERLEAFLDHVSLIQQEQIADRQKKGNNYVTLMTLHSVKGLEFKIVFIVGMEEGLFPHSRSFIEQKEMEEERRLCYVGITRSKKDLYLIHAKQRMYFGSTQTNPRSRFIEDIPKKLIKTIVTNRDLLRHSKSKSSWSTAWDDFDQTIDEEQNNYETGMTVKHEIFGKGKIVGLEEKLIIINFEDFGTKKLAADFAELEVI